MKGREPWLGVLTIVGLTLMLVGVEVVGFVVAVVPVVHGVAAFLRAPR